jgi:hypothetical protein
MKTKQRWSTTQFWMFTAATLLVAVAVWLVLIAGIVIIGRTLNV